MQKQSHALNVRYESYCKNSRMHWTHDVVAVHFRRQEVQVHDAQRAVRVPQLRVVLDEVEAQRDDKVGVLEQARVVVPGGQADGEGVYGSENPLRDEGLSVLYA